MTVAFLTIRTSGLSGLDFRVVGAGIVTRSVSEKRRGLQVHPRLRFLKLRIPIVAERRQRIAWGVSPRKLGKKRFEPRRGDSNGRVMQAAVAPPGLAGGMT